MDRRGTEDPEADLAALSSFCSKDFVRVKLEYDFDNLQAILERLVKHTQEHGEVIHLLGPKLDRLRAQVKENADRLTSLSRRQQALEQQFLKQAELVEDARHRDGLSGQGLERLQVLEQQLRTITQKEPLPGGPPTELAPEAPPPRPEPDKEATTAGLADVLGQLMARVEERLTGFRQSLLSDCHDVATAAAASHLETHKVQQIRSAELEVQVGAVQVDVDSLYHLLDLKREEATGCRCVDTTVKLRVLHQLPVFGLLLQRIRKLEDEGQFFSKRIGKATALLEGKADAKLLDSVRAELSSTRQRLDVDIASLDGRLRHLDQTKADISVHKLLGDAKLGLLALEDLRTDLTLDMERVNGGLALMRDHLRVLTEENDAFREALQQLKSAEVEATRQRRELEQKSRKSNSVLARLSEVSRLHPDWADVNQNRLTAALSLAVPAEVPFSPPSEDVVAAHEVPSAEPISASVWRGPSTPHPQERRPTPATLQLPTNDTPSKAKLHLESRAADSLPLATAPAPAPAPEPPPEPAGLSIELPAAAAEGPGPAMASQRSPARTPQRGDPGGRPATAPLGPPHTPQSTQRREVILCGTPITRRSRTTPRGPRPSSKETPKENRAEQHPEADLAANSQPSAPVGAPEARQTEGVFPSPATGAAAAAAAIDATSQRPPPSPPPPLLYDGFADLTALDPTAPRPSPGPLPDVMTFDPDGAIVEYYVPAQHMRPADPNPSLWVGHSPSSVDPMRRRGSRATPRSHATARQAPNAAARDRELASVNVFGRKVSH